MKSISLTKGFVSIVDDEDYEWLSKFNWIENGGYAVTNTYIEDTYRQNIRMHRMIMEAPKNKLIDHINGNKLDNRKENLRIVTNKENNWNSSKKNIEIATSKFKGVWKRKDKFIVKVCFSKKDNISKHVGTFTNEIAAANAYNYYAQIYFKEYARLNDVPFMEISEWEKYKIKRIPKSKQFKESKKVERIDSSVYRGVSWCKKRNSWEVNVWDSNKKYFVGYFQSETEAALAWNKKAIELNIKNLDKKLNMIEEFEND